MPTTYRLLGPLLRLVGIYIQLFVISSRAQPKRIPIGSLFDQDGILEARAAFRYQVEKHNNRTTSASSDFKLDFYEKILDVKDQFQMIRTECLTMSNGIFAILGVTDATSQTIVETLGRTFRMPHVTPNEPTFLRTSTLSEAEVASGFTLYLHPVYDRAILALLRHLKWTRFYYLYDNNEGLLHLEQLYSAINDQDAVMEIEVVHLADVQDCYSTLREIDQSQPSTDKHVLLDLSSHTAFQTVLNQILHLGMHRSGYHYVVGGLTINDMDLSQFRYGGVNISGFRLVDPNQSIFEETYRDWTRIDFPASAYRSEQARHQLSLEACLTMDAVRVIVYGLQTLFDDDKEILRSTFRHGHVYNGEIRGIHCTNPPVPMIHGLTILNYFRKVKLNGLSGHVAFDERGFRKDFTLDLLSMSFDKPLLKIGTWNDSHGLFIQETNKFTNGRVGGGPNATVVITTVMDAPYLIMKKKQVDDAGKPLEGNERYDGFCAELAKKLANIVQYEYILKVVSDGKYGAEQPDGSWNGMIGELVRVEADMAIAPLTITSVRERVVDFSKPFMNLGISIMIKKPEKQKPGVFSFMDPIDNDIWTCICFSYLGVSLTLFLVCKFSPYEWEVEEGDDGPTFTTDFTLRNSLWFALGAFMQQGVGMSPKSLSGRLAGSSWWFFTLIIISSYTANLAAFLTVERMLTPINGADDLIKQSEIQYGTLDSGSSKAFFENSNISVYKQMWRVMSSSDPAIFVKSTDEGVAKVRTSKGKYAFLLESAMNEYHNQKKPCNTMRVGDNLDSKGYGIATPIGHPLRMPIGLAVLSLKENGELQKLQKKWWYDKGECPADGDGKGGGSSQSALTLSNVAGIFYILISGLGLSMIVSLLEFLSKSFQEAKRQKKSLTQFLRCKSQRNSKISETKSREFRPGEDTVAAASSTSLVPAKCLVPAVRSSTVSLV